MCAQVHNSRKTIEKSEIRIPRQVKAALSEFQQRILKLFPGEITQIILYGSYARGEARPDSDVDVMIVVKWSDPERKDGLYLDNVFDPRWLSILDEAIQVMIDQRGPYITPLVIGERALEANVPIVREAMREGILLWKSRPT